MFTAFPDQIGSAYSQIDDESQLTAMLPAVLTASFTPTLTATLTAGHTQ